MAGLVALRFVLPPHKIRLNTSLRHAGARLDGMTGAKTGKELQGVLVLDRPQVALADPTPPLDVGATSGTDTRPGSSSPLAPVSEAGMASPTIL